MNKPLMYIYSPDDIKKTSNNYNKPILKKRKLDNRSLDKLTNICKSYKIGKPVLCLINKTLCYPTSINNNKLIYLIENKESTISLSDIYNIEIKKISQ